MRVPGQARISYGFDNNDNIVSISQGGQTTSFTRDALNRTVLRSLPNGVATEWNIDWNGYLTDMDSKRNGAIFDVHNYTRDREANITQEVVNGVTNSYAYDELSRLASATVSGVSSSWTYDQVGNRLSQSVGGATTSYTYNAGDQLTAVNGAAVTSDANGCVTAYGSDTYTWDVRGRLAGISRPGLTASFGYRQDGLRTSKTLNGTTTAFLLDGSSIVSETTGGTTTPVLQGPGTDQILARNGKWLVPDQLGNTVALTDGSGAVTQSYSYTPFGELANTPTDSNPFQFTGRENDGTGLMYYRARYYAPQWGRFLSEDPLGVDAGINSFVYGNNNPVNATDPTGNDWLDTASDFFGGWGDTLTGGLTQTVRGWLGAGQTVNHNSLAYRVGVGVGITHMVALTVVDAVGSAGSAATDVEETEAAAGTGQTGAGSNPTSASNGGNPGAAGGEGDPVAGSENGSGGGGDPGGCFVAGTPVQMADGTTQPIEEVQPGDLVMSRNPATGETAPRPVVRTFAHEHPGTLLLHLAGGEVIETTVEHPFWVAGVGFVPAGRLAIGTSVVTRAGPAVQIDGIEARAQRATVYNLEVAEFHTYFVGWTDGGLWVHNTCPASWNDPSTLTDHFGRHGGDFGAGAIHDPGSFDVGMRQ